MKYRQSRASIEIVDFCNNWFSAIGKVAMKTN